MTNKMNGDKNICQYERRGYKCNRYLYDDEYCIFHSYDIKGKGSKFNNALRKEYKQRKANERLNFIGFIFPADFVLKKLKINGNDFQRADLRGAILEGADIQGINLQGARLINANLEGANLEGGELQEARLHSANLQGANLKYTNLNKVIFKKTNLKNAKFQGAKLKQANLQGAMLQGADLNGASLQYARLKDAEFENAGLQGADFESIDFQYAKLRLAKLQRANLKEAILKNANLKEASLQDADLTYANLEGANLEFSSLEKAIVTKVKFNRLTKFLGVDVTQAKGSPRFVRFAKDQEYLEELKSTKSGKFIYCIWSVFADCGRSISRWTLWSVLFALIFAFIYHNIFYLNDMTSFNTCSIHETFPGLSFIYYSVVTFTTLGFGDIVPKPGWLQFWVMLEVILGYIMLGGLISIFANKLARRS